MIIVIVMLFVLFLCLVHEVDVVIYVISEIGERAKEPGLVKVHCQVDVIRLF